MDKILIGKRIRNKRKESNLLLSQLSEKTGISVAHISSIERGKCTFSVENLFNISYVLKTDVNYLLFGEESYSNIINFHEIIEDCNQYEKRIIIDNARYLKEILRKNII